MSSPDPGSPCPDESRLQRLLQADARADATLRSVGVHVDGCVECQQRLQALTSRPLAWEPGRGELAARGDGAGSEFAAEVEPFVQRLWETFRDPMPAAQVQQALAAFRTAAEVTGLGARQIGPYRIERCAGKGGMSVVYRATDTRLDRTVALKMLMSRPGDASGARRDRIAREAAALARLSHPHIVPLYEVGEHQGQMYLVLEYIAGPTLARWALGRPLDPAEAAQAVQTLARAVQHAHEHGVIHRDLKPGNVLLRPLVEVPSADAGSLPLAAYRLMISDFGLARWRDDEAERLTLSGQPVGTPAYMAPEQIQGADAPIGPATDVYALGAILFELLTGRPPFQTSTVLGTFQLIETSEPVPPRLLMPSVPRDLETIALKCLEKEPRRRYASAAALAEDLERFQTHRPIVARPVGWPGRAVRWARRNPAGALALGLVVALAVGGLISAQVQRRLRTQAETREQQALRAEAQSSLHLRGAIFLVDQLASSLHQLGPSLDDQIPIIRERSYTLGVQWCQQYLAAHPDSTRWSLAELQVAAVLVRLQGLRGRAASVQALAGQVEAAADRLVAAAQAADGPDAAPIVRSAGDACLALVHLGLGRPAQALVCLERADRDLGRLLDLTPGVPELIGQRFALQGYQAEALDQLGEPEQALAVALASLPPLYALHAPEPRTIQYLRLLYGQRTVELAGRLSRLGRADEARTLVVQALETLDHSGLTQAGSDPEFQALRQILLRRWVTTLADAPPDQLALALTELHARTATPNSPLVRPLDLDLARLFRDAGQPEPARQLARSAATDPALTPAALVDCAALLATLADTADLDPSTRTADQEQALTLLERARRAGGLADAPGRDPLDRRPEFASLRSLPRFQRLLDAPAATPPPTAHP